MLRGRQLVAASRSEVRELSALECLDLDLSGNAVPAKECTKLAEALTELPALAHLRLDLRYGALSALDARAVAEHLAEIPSLESRRGAWTRGGEFRRGGTPSELRKYLITTSNAPGECSNYFVPRARSEKKAHEGIPQACQRSKGKGTPARQVPAARPHDARAPGCARGEVTGRRNAPPREPRRPQLRVCRGGEAWTLQLAT